MLEYCKNAVDGIADKINTLAEEVAYIKSNGSNNSNPIHANTADKATTLTGLTASVTELNYTDGVTSNIQTQLNNKANADHAHNYARSSTPGGPANSANKLNTDAGNENTPVYFKDGIPVPITSIKVNVSGNAETATHADTATTLTGMTVSVDELNHMIGAEANIQDQINLKAPIDHTHNAAGEEFGFVRSGGDVTITDGVITLNDQNIHDITGLQDALDSKETAGASTQALNSANTYTDQKINDLITVVNSKEVAGAAAEALINANAYTDQKIGVVNTAIDGKEDIGVAAQALADANAYTDQKIGSINTAIDGKETAGAAAQALIDANTYTDQKIGVVNAAIDGKETAGAAAQALADANAYTDKEIATLIGTAPELRDTLGELNDAIKDNADVIAVLEEVAASKADAEHTHSYAGSSTVGGAANSANKLNTDAGDAGTPIYFKDGVPVECTSIKVNVSGNVDSAAFADKASESDTLTGLTASIDELNYVKGVTSNIQTQLDNKESAGAAAKALSDANEYTNTQISNHTHNYAGSNSIGGAANSANKLNTDAGDSSTPVYFKDGIPVPITSIKVNVSGNAETASKADEATTLSGMNTSVTELNYVKGVTSNIQTQLDNKLDSTSITIATDAQIQALFS
jgi:hypothetical protein